MKLTEEKLMQIIKEELEAQQNLNETQDPARQLKELQKMLDATSMHLGGQNFTDDPAATRQAVFDALRETVEKIIPDIIKNIVINRRQQ